MPLYEGCAELLRHQLNEIRLGKKVKIIGVGTLTAEQHSEICRLRRQFDLPEVESPEIVYLGVHHFDSRSRQGYTIEDMILQIQASIATESVPFLGAKMTVLRSVMRRADGYGNFVRDEAVFELMRRKPRAELYSVVPKGDKISPMLIKKQQSP